MPNSQSWSGQGHFGCRYQGPDQKYGINAPKAMCFGTKRTLFDDWHPQVEKMPAIWRTAEVMKSLSPLPPADPSFLGVDAIADGPDLGGPYFRSVDACQ